MASSYYDKSQESTTDEYDNDPNYEYESRTSLDDEDESSNENESSEEGESFENDNAELLNQNKIFLILNSSPSRKYNPNKQKRYRQQMQARNSTRRHTRSCIKKKKYRCFHLYNRQEKEFFTNLSNEEKDNIENIENKLITIENQKEPIRFKFLKLDITDKTKKVIISKIDNLKFMSQSGSGEFYKLHNWVNLLNNIPFGKYFELPIKYSDSSKDICYFLESVRSRMDSTIYGHKEAKEQIVRILAQLISFPKAKGYIIGLQGNAGVGKTKLIKEGICNALNYPHAFISLGGMEDTSFLKGHSYTYEGATYGKICECLIKTNIMNPLILFDELDKVSDSYKGHEIINTLIHITDPVQNDKFTDRYFEEIDLDISRSMIIFTFNDESQINPILRDRMIVINVPGYKDSEKLVLAKDYLIPEILKQYNIDKNDIIFSDNILKYIIEHTEKEEGVRNLKRSLNNIVSWINMMRYISIDDIKISFPFEVSIQYFEDYCKTSKNINRDVLYSMYT